MAMRGGWLFIVIVGLGSPSAPAFAQRAPQALRHMHHTSWGSSDGVVPAAQGAMRQSGDGYLWLEARGGLLRFDGVRFHLVDSVDAPALRSTTPGVFRPLFADREGVLWASRPDGALLRYANNAFDIVLGPDRQRSRSLRGIQDGAGRIWLESSNRLYELAGGRLTQPTIIPSGVDTTLSSVIADSGTGIWFGTRGAVWHMTSGRIKRYAVPTTDTTHASRPLCQLANGQLWVSTSESVLTFTDGVWADIRFGGKEFNASAVVESREHDALIATSGLGLLRAHDGQLEQFARRDGLSGSVLGSVITDNHGSVWATTEAGLDRLRIAPFTTLGAADSVPFDTPLHVIADVDGGVWVSTWNRGIVYHLSGGVVGGRGNTIRWRRQEQLPVTAEYRLLGHARGGGVWASEQRDGGAIMLRRIQLGASLPRAIAQLPSSSNILVEDRTGDIWVSTADHGFQRVHNGRMSAEPLPVLGKQPYVAWVAEDSVGHVWAANSKATALYEYEKGRLVATFDSSAGLTHKVQTIRAAGGDTVWLVLLDRRSGAAIGRIVGGKLRVVALPEAEELLRSGGLTVLTGRRDFWIAGEVGVARVLTEELNAYVDGRRAPPALRFYNREDGLALPKITGNNNYHGGAITQNGQAWFSTPVGLAVYDPDLDVPVTDAPHVVIEEVTAAGRRLARDSVLLIPPAPDRVEIHFTAPSLRIPSRVRIEYRLDGVDTAWVRSNTLRTASYSRMRPGRYRFRVRAWNEDGVPSAQEASLAIRVLPRWFESTAFTVLSGLLLVAGGPLLAIARTRARSAAREQRMRERFDATLAERGRLSRELHDTLLQGFTGITLKLQAVRATMLTAPDAAAEALSSVLDESDLALLDARQMIWDMRLTELEDRDLCDAIEESGRQMVGDAPIGFGVNVCGPRRRLSPRIESVLYRICRESVANALKHARATVIAVDITFEPGAVRLRVSDDGVGMSAGTAADAARRGHFGIVGMRERAARAGGTLSIVSSAHGGTAIELSMPTSSDDLAQH